MLTATLASGDALPGWLNFDAAKGTFSGTPAANDAGELALCLTATDLAGASISQNFILSIAAVSGRTLVGTTGYDQLNGTAGNDALDGGAGDDTYYVDSGADAIV